MHTQTLPGTSTHMLVCCMRTNKTTNIHTDKHNTIRFDQYTPNPCQSLTHPHIPTEMHRPTPCPSTTLYSTPSGRHLAANFSCESTGLQPLSQDRGTPELRRISPCVRAQSAFNCCCITARNLHMTVRLLYGTPLLLHLTTQMDSSSSSRRYVQSCRRAGGGCHIVLSSNSRMRTLPKSTANAQPHAFDLY